MARAERARTPTAAIHSAGPVVGRKPITRATIITMRERQEGLDHAADDVTGEDRRPTDGHRLESVDDPLGHVHRDRERRALGGAGNGDQQDARQHVRGVFGPSTGHATQAGPERSAENEHEQQQEDHGDAGDEEGQRRVAAHPAEVAPEHRRGIGQDQWICVHRTVAFSCVGSPVSDRKTSSRSGVSTVRPATSIESASSRSRRARRSRPRRRWGSAG